MTFLNLSQAFRVTALSSVAFVGSGGKTTAMFRLAGQLPPPVVISASTHLRTDQLAYADRHQFVMSANDIESLDIKTGERLLLTGPMGEDNRTHGLKQEELQALHRVFGGKQLPILIEADGSRQLPIKAVAAHEPAVPNWVNTVVVVVGMSGLGLPLDDQTVHRPGMFAKISGLEMGELITPESLIKYLLHPMGGQKNIPAGARRIALLNQVESPELLGAIRPYVEQLLAGFDSVVIAEMKRAQDAPNLAPGGVKERIHAVHETTAGVVLAAGSASRYGQPKLLLPWRGKPLVRQVVETALLSGLSPVTVVLGAYVEPIRSVLADLPVSFVINEAWEEGQSTSVGAGVGSLPSNVGSAVFLLGDQPQIPSELVGKLAETHRKTLASIVAPRVESQRANPVLFDQRVFTDLTDIKGDQGGRAVFSRYPKEWVTWEEESILLDVDTPDDYSRLKELE